VVSPPATDPGVIYALNLSLPNEEVATYESVCSTLRCYLLAPAWSPQPQSHALIDPLLGVVLVAAGTPPSALREGSAGSAQRKGPAAAWRPPACILLTSGPTPGMHIVLLYWSDSLVTLLCGAKQILQHFASERHTSGLWACVLGMLVCACTELTL
jgi:hypothetical protein